VRTPTIRTKRSVRMFFHTTRLNNRKPWVGLGLLLSFHVRVCLPPVFYVGV
jgi:hypothetical protein